MRILRHPPILNNLILPPELDIRNFRLDLLDWIGQSFGFQVILLLIFAEILCRKLGLSLSFVHEGSIDSLKTRCHDH